MLHTLLRNPVAKIGTTTKKIKKILQIKPTKQYCSKGILHYCIKIPNKGWFVIKMEKPTKRLDDLRTPSVFSISSVQYVNTPEKVRDYICENITKRDSVKSAIIWLQHHFTEYPLANYHGN